MTKDAIIFSDIDGTTYGKNFTPKQDTVKDVHEAIDNNIEFVFTTGNPPFSRIRKLSNQFKCRYAITSNGASIYDFQDDKYIMLKTIEASLQKTIIDIADKYQLQLNFWNDEHYFTWNKNPNYSDTYHYPLLDISNVKETNNIQNNVVKMELFGNASKITKAFEELKMLDLQIINMREDHIEITAKNVNKGTAIEWFLENIYPDHKLNDVMTIGDSPNDWEMLKRTVYSYAVANATEDTKKHAKLNTAAHDQNGLGLAVKDYMYRKLNIKPKK